MLHKLMAKLLFAFLLMATTALANQSPVTMLEHVADQMISGLKANQANLKNKPDVVYRLAYKYVVPHADIEAMAKRVLPRAAWQNATNEQRKRFQAEFTRTLIRTYASALTSYNNQAIHFYPVRKGYEQNIEVKSDIVSPDRDTLHVVYRLLQSHGQWYLYDMAVEGVSMLESFRSQFASILARDSMEALLQRMAQHNRSDAA